MKWSGAEILDTIANIDSAEDSQTIIDTFTKHVEAYGITGVLIGQIVDSETVRKGNPLRVSTWPTELLNARVDQRAATHDPIIAYALKTSRPFFWDQAFEYATRYGRKITSNARDYGLKNGLMIPVMDLEKTPGGVSLGGEQLDVTPEDVRILSLISNHCYFRLEEMMGPYPFEVRANLSGLETDALHFAASGKTTWETSRILDVSEASVKNALKRARTKLGADTTVHATAIAMRKRIII